MNKHYTNPGPSAGVFFANALACGLLAMTLIVGGARGASDARGGGLAGTSWRLVKFQSMDDTTLVPRERDRFTIAFGGDGKATLRIDCNRGLTTWSSPDAAALRFGPLALTRASCPSPVADRLAKDIEYVRSYVMKDGHLYVSLLADGGIYEFEPLK